MENSWNYSIHSYFNRPWQIIFIINSKRLKTNFIHLWITHLPHFGLVVQVKSSLVPLSFFTSLLSFISLDIQEILLSVIPKVNFSLLLSTLSLPESEVWASARIFVPFAVITMCKGRVPVSIFSHQSKRQKWTEGIYEVKSNMYLFGKIPKRSTMDTPHPKISKFAML